MVTLVRRAVVVCALWTTGVAFASRPAWAQGLVWEAQMTAEGEAPRTMRVLTGPQRFKVEELDGSMHYLVRLDRGEMYFLDTKKRTYQKMKLADLERAAQNTREQMQAAWKHMQKELQSIPAEQRRLLEHMVGERKAGATQVRKTGRTKTIAGYPCTEYVAESEGRTLLTACTTDRVPNFDAVRKDWLAAQDQLGKLNPFGGHGLRDAYGEIPGFPLETEMGGVHAVVTKVQTTPPPAAEFEVPADFQLRPGPPLPR